MTDSSTTRRLGVLYMTLASVAWSTAGIFTRFATTDLVTTMFWRSLFAGLGMLAVLVLFQGLAGLASFRRMGLPGVLISICGGTAAFVTVPAMQLTSVAHVVVIYATAPFLAGGLAWALFGQRPGRVDVLASLAALVGAAVMIGLSPEGGIWGDLLALVLALTMSGVMVLMRQFPSVPSLPTAVIAFGLSTLACLTLTPDLAIAAAELPFLAAFGLVNSALGTAFFLLGSRLLRPVETAILGALETPLAPLWVWIVLGEIPGLATALGGGIVMAAVIWHTLHSARST
jgi:drug/metabolite transporter (DMT)-like permease